jgi:hypothetical protein
MGVFGFRVVFGKNGKSGVFGWPAVGGLVGEQPAVMFWWWGGGYGWWVWVIFGFREEKDGGGGSRLYGWWRKWGKEGEKVT